MGVEVSVTFVSRLFEPEDIFHVLKGAGGKTYFLIGRPCLESAHRPYFSIWSSTSIKLNEICEQLSKNFGPICTAWKAEHGGVGGYLIFERGTIVTEKTTDGSEYLSVPCQGVELCWGTKLNLSADRKISFPELLIK